LKDAVDICAVMHYNEYSSLINHGLDPEELSVFYLRDYGMNFPEDGIYCMEKTLSEDPDMCKNFVNASIEGWNYALKNPEESLMLMKKIQKQETVQFNSTRSAWMLKSMQDAIHPPGLNTLSGDLLESDYKNTVEFLFENRMISNRPDYRIFYRGNIKK
jgi:NitT/TauT family transport system substrate-binding protein